jgi:hypothetical protein
MLVLAMHTAPQAYPAPRKQAFYCPQTLAYISVPLGKSSRGRPRQGVQRITQELSTPRITEAEQQCFSRLPEHRERRRKR